MRIFAALYIDEDMSALVATLLQSRGLDIETTQAAGCMGRSDVEQLAYAISVGRCLLTHNRVDFEQIHLQMIERGERHFGIIIVPQKNAYEIARRVGLLLDSQTADEIARQLLYV
ncbi:DUF5615 family PIN-like protein [Leptolyngbya sp. CCNP1308]|uniref:DUF5615 family PIN-like protein n=1 Tax=Leptolyngbya sp. CCNP1308 TaxID=3110255 RepID=UPI002B20FFFA|nr:DUF5615 family PIN-like protein [Leptolyngbya sp. CCNP1308]MEA5451280.1 DUF5615 family PIN-like protein [Leptolyngbya sp. CCNP1308]